MIDSLLTKIFFALSSEARFKIYQMCLNEEINITELTKRIGFSYQMILKHLETLKDAGMIERKEVLVKGIKNVFIKSIPFREGTAYEVVYKKRLEEQDK